MLRISQLLCLPLIAAVLLSCTMQHRKDSASGPPGTPVPIAHTGSAVERTVWASIYSDSFEGRETASGEIFTQSKSTAASRSLPFGSRLQITNPETGQSTIVRVNDRGPHVAGRELDLSRAAAQNIGFRRSQGVMRVRVREINPK